MDQVNKLLAYTPLTGPGIQVGDSTTQLEKVISTVIGFLSVVAVIFFVIQIILAGYGFISASGDEKKMEISRKKITEGIIGLTVVIVALGFGALMASILGLGDIFNLNSVTNLLKFQ
jgi:hypothetical protein